MRALGYCRLVDDAEPGPGGGPHHPVGAFADQFAEYCDLNLHQPLDTYVEGGSGTDQFERMLEFMRDSGSEFLAVVPDARHLGSDLEAVARSLMRVEGTGSKVLCMDPDFPDPVQNAFQTLGIKGVSRTRSRRVKESMRRRAAQGKALGRPSFGYRIGGEGTLEVVPKEAAVVELIYRLYTSDDLGFRLIVQHLNERGITTRKGSPWNVVTVRDVLRNPAYTGTYSRFGLRIPRVHEPIVGPQVFKQAQDQMRARRPIGRVSRPEPFLLSGLAHCASCGNTMMGVTRRQKWKKKDGRRGSAVYRYYQCQSRQNQGRCEYRTWRASLLESTVLSQLRDKIAGRLAVGMPAADLRNRIEEVRRRRVGRAEAAEKRLVAAMKRVARAEIPLDLISDYLNALDAARRAVDGGGPRDQARTLELLDPTNSLGFEESRAILEDNVARIVVGDEAVDVQI